MTHIAIDLHWCCGEEAVARSHVSRLRHIKGAFLALGDVSFILKVESRADMKADFGLIWPRELLSGTVAQEHWPMYVLQVTKSEVVDGLVQTRDMRNFRFYARVHPSHHERIERHLNGPSPETSAVQELVQELRYNPSFIGGDVRATQASFAAGVIAQHQQEARQ